MGVIESAWKKAEEGLDGVPAEIQNSLRRLFYLGAWAVLAEQNRLADEAGEAVTKAGGDLSVMLAKAPEAIIARIEMENEVSAVLESYGRDRNCECEACEQRRAKKAAGGGAKTQKAPIVLSPTKPGVH